MKTRDIGVLDCPVLIFGGPYSNLQATQAMLNFAEQNNISPNHVICTGDIVAYCGDPNETVDLIREWSCHVVMGNCEQSVGFEADDCACGFDQGSECAVLSVDWYSHAVNNVNSSNKQWMQSLPLQIHFSLNGLQITVIHGGVDNISEFIFQSSRPQVKLDHLARLKSDCIIGGHCGLPFGEVLYNCKDEEKFWLNAGVIGMPANEGKTHCWFMTLDAKDGQVVANWHMLDFDNQSAIQAMADAGLPNPYQLTLENGRWPSMSVLPKTEQANQGKLWNISPITLRRQ